MSDESKGKEKEGSTVIAVPRDQRLRVVTTVRAGLEGLTSKRILCRHEERKLCKMDLRDNPYHISEMYISRVKYKINISQII